MRYDRDFSEHARGYEYDYTRSPRGYEGTDYGYGAELEEDLGYDGAFGESGRKEEMMGRGEYGEAYEGPYGGEWESRDRAPRGERQRAGPRTAGRFHGYGMGYGGGALRSRGSFQAGQLRSGLNPEDEFEFEWGEGYVGGRGYAGTNYDLRHGYRVGSPREEMRRGWRSARDQGEREHQGRPREGGEEAERLEGLAGDGGGHATRGGYEWGPARAQAGTQWGYGPGRYGYGPYHERLRRRRRSDEEIREEVEETLFYDTWVDADRIEVSVQDGVVTLRGRLPNYDEVRYATDDAWEIDGVRGVRSELSVSESGAGREGE